MICKGAFTLANFARDFALSLHVLLNKNYLFSLLNVQASAKSHAKLRQCKRTLSPLSSENVYVYGSKMVIDFKVDTISVGIIDRPLTPVCLEGYTNS